MGIATGSVAVNVYSAIEVLALLAVSFAQILHHRCIEKYAISTCMYNVDYFMPSKKCLPRERDGREGGTRGREGRGQWQSLQ